MTRMEYVSWKKVGAVDRALDLHYEHTVEGVRLGIKDAMELLLKESRKIVPILKRVLYESSRVRISGRRKKDIEGSVEYRTPYALAQHENTWYRHKPGKSAKYLEKPARRNRRKMAEMIRKRAEKVRKAKKRD